MKEIRCVGGHLRSQRGSFTRITCCNLYSTIHLLMLIRAATIKSICNITFWWDEYFNGRMYRLMYSQRSKPLHSPAKTKQCANTSTHSLLTLWLERYSNLSTWHGSTAAVDAHKCKWTAAQEGSSWVQNMVPPGPSPANGPAWQTLPCHMLPRSLIAPPGGSCHCRLLPVVVTHPAQS